MQARHIVECQDLERRDADGRLIASSESNAMLITCCTTRHLKSSGEEAFTARHLSATECGHGERVARFDRIAQGSSGRRTLRRRASAWTGVEAVSIKSSASCLDVLMRRRDTLMVARHSTGRDVGSDSPFNKRDSA